MASQNFDGVVGQTAITDTLKMQSRWQDITCFCLRTTVLVKHHVQRFLKALATNLQMVSQWVECENCLAADRGTMNDIIEIDAASNNGVDEIRDIR